METITVSPDGEAIGGIPPGTEVVDAQGNPVSIVQVTIPNHPVQVQSVIQNAPSVIHTANGQTIHAIQVAVGSDNELSEDEEHRKRREILARRPSYRKILNDLSSDSPSVQIAKIEEESNSSQTSQDSQEVSDAANSLSASSSLASAVQAAVQYQTATGTVQVVPAGTIQVAASGDGTQPGLQTLTLTNASQAATSQGATIVQYAQGPDGQFFIPAGNLQGFQLTTPTSLPQGVVMAAAPQVASPQQVTEEASRKRELRLLKNRDAAKECRRKKKEYIKCLENRVAVLENQNKALIEELKSLKEVYCQKEAVSQ